MTARGALPLWPLPLLIALVSVTVVHVAFALSAQAGFVPACVPYLEGCTSISRAARHGVANDLFRWAMVPCALLQGLHWIGARRWLQHEHAAARAGRSLPAFGLLAALALAVYAIFLGTEGDAYRWLRRYGVVLYFGATYLAQLVVARHARALAPPHPRLWRAMLALNLGVLGLGLGSVAASALMADDPRRDAVENVLEWNLALLIYAWFVVLALWWRRTNFVWPISDDRAAGGGGLGLGKV